ncbi:MAG: LysM domain-containing protein [Byssovorax sp.]
MSQVYRVEQGDDLFTIAEKFGFNDWRTVYHDPSNAPFRALRPNR